MEYIEMISSRSMELNAMNILFYCLNIKEIKWGEVFTLLFRNAKKKNEVIEVLNYLVSLHFISFI